VLPPASGLRLVGDGRLLDDLVAQRVDGRGQLVLRQRGLHVLADTVDEGSTIRPLMSLPGAAASCYRAPVPSALTQRGIARADLSAMRSDGAEFQAMPCLGGDVTVRAIASKYVALVEQ